MTDPATGRLFRFPKENGSETIDEGPKSVTFSTHARLVGEISKETKLRPEYKAYTIKWNGRKSNSPLPQGAVLQSSTEHDAKWFRSIRVAVPPNSFEIIEEQITYLDPYFAYMISPTHLWASSFRTSELDPGKVRRLLSTHPELIEANGKPDAAKRIARARFMLDAGWLKYAKDDLEEIGQLFPSGVPAEVKDALQKLQKDVDSATTGLVIKELELALSAGRYKYAADLQKAFPEKQADARQLDEATKLMAHLEATKGRYESGRRLLSNLLDEVTGLIRARPALAVGGGLIGAVWTTKTLPTPLTNLVAAAEKVYAELHPDTALRIDSFVNLASQAERERLQGRDATKNPSELLATVISGWALGKNGANPDATKALKVWGARETVLAYQRSDDLNTRNRILREYKNSTLVSIDELAQIISLLPPAEPENLLVRSGSLVSDGNRVPPELYKRTTTPTGEHPSGVPYYIKLPPEYHHGRAYPVLMVLGAPNFPVESILGSLTYEADRNGYILLAPDWTNQFGKGWEWKGEQHGQVTAVLREAVRNFCIDNDRVFLVGVGDGANMAMDISISHPDLFAGVLPVSPIPKWTNFFSEYWRNAQALPFYIVIGQLAGPSLENCRQIFDRWMPRGYPSLLVTYRGRGVEWYSAEIPTMFDWMGRKKRTNITGVLKLDDRGRQPWTIMRATDNRFYWLSVEKVQNQRLLENVKSTAIVPATIQGDVNGNNLIRITSQGVLKFSILLTSDLIDWQKGITVVINNTTAPGYSRPKKLEPNLDILLEDYRERGDRRVLLWGRLEFSALP